MEAIPAKLSAKSALVVAIACALKRWLALIPYSMIDNLVAEPALRGVARSRNSLRSQGSTVYNSTGNSARRCHIAHVEQYPADSF